MSEYTTGPTPGPADDEPGVYDLTKNFPAEYLAELETAMQAEASLSEHGRRGAMVGTIIEPTIPQQRGWATEAAARALPAWAADPETLARSVRQARAEAVYRVLFHTMRTPAYAARVLLLASRGAWAAPRDAAHFFLAGEYNTGIKAAKKSRDDARVLVLRDEKASVTKDRQRSARHLVATGGSLTYVGAAVLTAMAGQWIVAGPLLALLTGVLAVIGHKDKTGADPAFHLLDATPTTTGPVTDTRIEEAFRAAGVIGAKEALQFTGAGTGREKTAAVATLKLPAGTIAADAIKKLREIAGALDVAASQVDIRQEGAESRLSIWIADKDPFATSRRSPLLTHRGPIDAFTDGIPVVFDKRGQAVPLTIRDAMLLIAGMTRSGKGVGYSSVVCGAGMDPRINIRNVYGKATGEHVPYAPVCATFFKRNPERLALLLQILEKELLRREDRLADLGTDKLTPRLLEEMPIELVLIDEFAFYVGDEKDETAKQIIASLKQIAAMGAALGVLLVLATQDPNAKLVPSPLRRNFLNRWAMRVESADASNAILGGAASGAGFDSSKLPEGTPSGVGHLRTIDGTRLTRSYFIDRERGEVDELIARGVVYRSEAGRLAGQFDDPIEQALLAATGFTSASGGPRGDGRPGKADMRQSSVRGLLGELLQVFASAGNPERLTTSAIVAGLARINPADWQKVADDTAANAGTALKNAITRALAKDAAEAGRPPRILDSDQWGGKDKGRGYWLTAVRAAAGIVQ
jgi:S-DNA-T family DNA segregation ATPase FtsK/SpoIIIE